MDSTVDGEQPDMQIEHEVPDWSQVVEVEMGAPESFSFQVSPENSPDSSDYDFNNVPIKIFRPLAKDAHWSSLDGQGVPANELCTSPGSQWSETSSGEDLEEPQYTSLVSPDDIWSPSLPQTIFAYTNETSL